MTMVMATMKTCKTTLNSIVEEASHVLSDQEAHHEFTTWSQELLRRHACTILGLLVAIHPSAFTKTISVKLKPGSTQDLASECDKFLGVVRFLNPDGSELLANESKDIDFLRRMASIPDPCGDTMSPSGISYSQDPQTPGVITVVPQVTADNEITAEIKCASVADIIADPDKEFPPEALTLVPAIREWILYSARAADDEINDCPMAQQHYNAFLALVPAAAEYLAARAKKISSKQ